MKNYQPFGDEFKAELMKWKKEDLVNRLTDELKKSKTAANEKESFLQNPTPPPSQIIKFAWETWCMKKELSIMENNFFDFLQKFVQTSCPVVFEIWSRPQVLDDWQKELGLVVLPPKSKPQYETEADYLADTYRDPDLY